MKSLSSYITQLHEGIASKIAANVIKMLLMPKFKKEFSNLEKKLNDPAMKTSLMRYHNKMKDIEERLNKLCKTDPNSHLCSDEMKRIILHKSKK